MQTFNLYFDNGTQYLGGLTITGLMATAQLDGNLLLYFKCQGNDGIYSMTRLGSARIDAELCVKNTARGLTSTVRLSGDSLLNFACKCKDGIYSITQLDPVNADVELGVKCEKTLQALFGLGSINDVMHLNVCGKLSAQNNLSISAQQCEIFTQNAEMTVIRYGLMTDWSNHHMSDLKDMTLFAMAYMEVV